MALKLAQDAETAICGFYQSENAVEALGKLYHETTAAVEENHAQLAATGAVTPRVLDTTQSILDIAVQKVVESLSWRLQTEPDASPESVGVPALLDMCISGVVKEYLLNSAAYRVLEDLMEGQTIDTCEKLWDLLEARKARLSTREFIPESGRPTKASLCLLRLCNALLRRVSKTHNSVFCGRILVFLSFTFALSERSAVNLLGKPNVSNSTVYEDQEEFDAAEASDSQPASVPLSIELDKESASDSAPVDYNLYRTFWDLQRFCRDHQLAFKSADDWEKFMDELNTVLSAFEGNAFSRDDLERSRDLMIGSGGSGNSPDDSDMGNATDTDNENASSSGAQEHFFQPKYLTNSRLFRLQLRDPILRECMLTQFLILFNYLSKAKQPDGCTTPKSNLTEMNARVTKLLRETPSDGKGFSEMLATVLERERNWIKWKLDRCPPYERLQVQDAPMKKRRLGDAGALSARPPLAKRARQNGGDASSSAMLDQILSASAKPAAILEKIKAPDRATVVPMEKFIERFTEAWDPENGIEKEYWPDTDKLYCWRTMRMAMKSNVEHMQLAVNGAGAVVKGILGVPEASADDANATDDQVKGEDKHEATQSTSPKQEVGDIKSTDSPIDTKSSMKTEP